MYVPACDNLVFGSRSDICIFTPEAGWSGMCNVSPSLQPKHVKVLGKYAKCTSDTWFMFDPNILQQK